MTDRVIITQKQADALLAAGVSDVEVAYTIPRSLAEILGTLMVKAKAKKPRAKSVMLMSLVHHHDRCLATMRQNTVTHRAAVLLSLALNRDTVYTRSSVQDTLRDGGFSIAEAVWLPKSLLTVGFLKDGETK